MDITKQHFYIITQSYWKYKMIWYYPIQVAKDVISCEIVSFARCHIDLNLSYNKSTISSYLSYIDTDFFETQLLHIYLRYTE